MTVPDSFTIASSFTALSLTGCTTALAVIRKHGRASRAGHGFVTLITAGLAVVSTFSAHLDDSVLGTVTNSLLCLAIGAAPLVQFEILNDALGPLGVLPLYASRCIVFARVFAILKTSVVMTFIFVPHLSNILLSVFLFAVTLEYIILTVISFYLHTHRVQPIYPSMALAFLVSSTLGFCYKDMSIISWLFWALLLLVSLLPSCLLLAHEVRGQYIFVNIVPRRYRVPEEIQLRLDVPTNDSTSTSTSAHFLVCKSKRFGHGHCQGILQDPVYWTIQVNGPQSSSQNDCEVAQAHEEPDRGSLASNARRLDYLQATTGSFHHNYTVEQQRMSHGQNPGNVDAHASQLIHSGEPGNGIQVTTDICVDHGKTAVFGAGYFTNTPDGLRWNYPWTRIGSISYRDADGPWKTRVISCHWRRWLPGATAKQH